MIRFFMMLSLCIPLTSYWAGLANLLGEPTMTVSRIVQFHEGQEACNSYTIDTRKGV